MRHEDQDCQISQIDGKPEKIADARIELLGLKRWDIKPESFEKEGYSGGYTTLHP